MNDCGERGSPKRIQRFGPETWKEIEGRDWSLRDLWFCVVATLDHDGDLDAVADSLVDELRSHANRGTSFTGWSTETSPTMPPTGSGSPAEAPTAVRIGSLNLIRQAERFDPGGDYVRRYVPALAAIDGPVVHRPWLLDRDRTRRLDYPHPLVDHAEAVARFRAARSAAARRAPS